MAKNSEVFISYSSDTKPLAEQLSRVLQKQGFHPWADFKLRPGQRWQDAVDSAIDQACWFLILVSPESRTTPWIEAEWRAALTRVWSDSGKTLIPVLVGGDATPPFLRSWVPLMVDPVAEPENWCSHVVDALNSQRDWSPHGLTNEDRKERLQRFAEISHAAERLASSEPDAENEVPEF